MQRGGGSSGVTGNQETGLFTAAGRDRAATGAIGGTGMSGGGGGGGNRSGGGRGGGGPMRDNGRKRGGKRSSGLRGSGAHLPAPGGGRSDRDGDLDMGDKKSNFSPYQRPGKNRNDTINTETTSNDSLVVFVIGKGVGSDAGLLDFLSRKASPAKITPTNKKPNSDRSSISFHVPDFQQASALKALSGIRYKGQKIIIKTTGDQRILEESAQKVNPMEQSTGSTIDAIRTFIRSRHNNVNGILDLENMAADPTLRAAAVLPPGAAKGKFDVGAVFMKVAAELFPETTTISFASNELRSLKTIASVARFFPNIQNLSFKGNNIANFRDLEILGGAKKLPMLRELILMDNPIRDRDLAKNNDDIEYRSQVTKIFPTIQVLDQIPVGPKISFGLGDVAAGATPATQRLPAPVRGNFFDSPGTEALVLEFLTSFFQLFDTDRSALEHMYDNSATFSYSTVRAPASVQRGRNRANDDNWNDYPQSRNLSRIKDLKQRTSTIHVGNDDIVKQGLLTLPKTTHNLSDASKVRVDAWQTGTLLPAICIYIMVHGEFTQSNGKQKSFDRSFIIAPAPPTSQAAARGWKCLIITDQLTVRTYGGSDAWQPEPEAISSTPLATPNPNMPAPATPNVGAGPDSTQAPMPGINPEQHAKAQELQQLTGLNYPYSVQCLTAVAWDVAAGVALVNQERANIPQDAWQKPRF